MEIDWESLESYIFSNPRSLNHISPRNWVDFSTLRSHLWIETSGTTKASKWVALSKSAFLHSAEAVNAHLGSTAQDIWINALPLFHVGGLAIQARAFLSRSKVYLLNKWDPVSFIEILQQHRATLTALVPTQLFDLIRLKISAPHSLRAVIIGGGHLTDRLYSEACALNWPILISYGMTECSSQIATATLQDQKMCILPHIQCRISKDHVLQLKSSSLLSGYLEHNQWIDPKHDGWFTTNDKALIDHGFLQFLGRVDDYIKVSGENVSLFKLNLILEDMNPDKIEAYLIGAPDERLGKRIELITKKKYLPILTPLILKFNQKVMPFERIAGVKIVDELSRTPLGKITTFEDYKSVENLGNFAK